MVTHLQKNTHKVDLGVSGPEVVLQRPRHPEQRDYRRSPLRAILHRQRGRAVQEGAGFYEGAGAVRLPI